MRLPQLTICIWWMIVKLHWALCILCKNVEKRGGNRRDMRVTKSSSPLLSVSVFVFRQEDFWMPNYINAHTWMQPKINFNDFLPSTVYYNTPDSINHMGCCEFDTAKSFLHKSSRCVFHGIILLRFLHPGAVYAGYEPVCASHEKQRWGWWRIPIESQERGDLILNKRKSLWYLGYLLYLWFIISRRCIPCWVLPPWLSFITRTSNI